jgi:catechol 2,3-dioxygenase-like lactoylglutathione lyase family enzyme
MFCAKMSSMTAADESVSTVEPAPVTGLVPMIFVADVDRSAEFYRLLGFEIGNYVPHVGQKHWAWLYAPSRQLEARAEPDGDARRVPNSAW